MHFITIRHKHVNRKWAVTHRKKNVLPSEMTNEGCSVDTAESVSGTSGEVIEQWEMVQETILLCTVLFLLLLTPAVVQAFSHPMDLPSLDFPRYNI